MQAGSAILQTLRQPVSLKLFRRRPGSVRTRLTGAGWGFLVLILCGFLLSVNFSNNLILTMCFLLAGIALVGWYHTRVNVKGLAIADWRTTPVFAGQDAVYQMNVENPSAYARYALGGTSAKARATGEIHLRSGERAVLRLARKAEKRGLLKPAKAAVTSSFPLGIFETRLTTKPLPECLVYPKPQGGQPLAEQAVGGQAHLSTEAGDYREMRRYCPGDPLSRVSWKAFARFDELYTKEFDGAQGQPALWLRWQDVKAQGAEQKLSQLCRWVLDVHKQNREFGLELPGQRIGPAKEEAHLRQCLTALALHGATEKNT